MLGNFEIKQIGVKMHNKDNIDPNKAPGSPSHLIHLGKQARWYQARWPGGQVARWHQSNEKSGLGFKNRSTCMDAKDAKVYFRHILKHLKLRIHNLIIICEQ